MGGRTRQPGVAVAVLVVVVAYGAACGGGEGVAADTSVSRGSLDLPVIEPPDRSESPRSSVTWTVDSTEPAPPRPTECGTTTTPDGTDLTVVIASGWGECDDALALIDIYHRDRPAPSEDPDQHLVIDGWECATDGSAEPGPATTCELAGYGVVTART